MAQLEAADSLVKAHEEASRSREGDAVREIDHEAKAEYERHIAEKKARRDANRVVILSVRERQAHLATARGADVAETDILLAEIDCVAAERDAAQSAMNRTLKKSGELSLQMRGYRQAFGDFRLRVDNLVDPHEAPTEAGTDTWLALAELRRGEELLRLERAVTELRATVARGEHYTTIRRVQELETERTALKAAVKRLEEKLKEQSKATEP
jgi:chromosome segregation ATPase